MERQTGTVQFTFPEETANDPAYSTPWGAWLTALRFDNKKKEYTGTYFFDGQYDAETRTVTLNNIKTGAIVAFGQKHSTKKRTTNNWYTVTKNFELQSIDRKTLQTI